MRNLLYIVRLRALAKRAHVGVDRARGGGDGAAGAAAAQRSMATTSAPRSRRPPAATSSKTGAVTIGHAQLRIDLEAAGAGWRDMLVGVLEAAAGAAVAVA